MVWPHLEVFSFIKADCTGHSERKKEKVDKGRVGMTILKYGHGWTLPAQVEQLETDQAVRVGANFSAVPLRPCKVMGQSRIEYM